jgi:hypothetical protein
MERWILNLVPLTMLFIPKESDQVLNLAHDHEKGYETDFAMITRCKDNYGCKIH